MKLIKTIETDYYKFNNLSNYNEISHFVSTRIKKQSNLTSGNFNISLESEEDLKEIIKNRNLLSKVVEIPLNNFVMQNQVHGNNIKVITKKHLGKGVYNHSNAVQDNDAMITNESNICLFLFAADCVPLLFYDPIKKVIGAAHSGWQGTMKKIAQKTVLKMKEAYNSSIKDIIVGIGPSISVKNYEIGDNVLYAGKEAFGEVENYFKYKKETNKYHFDLWHTNKQLLIDIGIKNENIEISGLCTFDNNEIFFSARKKNTGRFGAGIMIK